MSQEHLAYQTGDLKVYLLPNSTDLNQLHSPSGGRPIEFRKWRTWNLALEMDNRKMEILLKEMAARLQAMEERLRRLENSPKLAEPPSSLPEPGESNPPNTV